MCDLLCVNWDFAKTVVQVPYNADSFGHTSRGPFGTPKPTLFTNVSKRSSKMTRNPGKMCLMYDDHDVTDVRLPGCLM